jgi:hypothetical protein
VPAQEQTYRASLIAVFFGLLIFGTLVAVVVVEVARGLGYDLPGITSATFLWMLCLLYVWVLVCTPVTAFAYSVSVSPRGIRGRTFWGRKRFIAWEDMNHVRRLGVPPFRFLRFRTNAGGPPMWFPLFVSGKKKLQRQIAAAVPEGHPIHDFL